MTVLANEGLDPDMSMCNEIDPKTEEALVVLQKLLSKKIQKNKWNIKFSFYFYLFYL